MTLSPLLSPRKFRPSYERGRNLVRQEIDFRDPKTSPKPQRSPGCGVDNLSRAWGVNPRSETLGTLDRHRVQRGVAIQKKKLDRRSL